MEWERLGLLPWFCEGLQPLPLPLVCGVAVLLSLRQFLQVHLRHCSSVEVHTAMPQLQRWCPHTG